MSSRSIPNPGFTKTWTASNLQYYISPTGNDSGSGSETNPWKTIDRALREISQRRFSSSVTVELILTAGVFRDVNPITISDSRKIPLSITGASVLTVDIESIVSVEEQSIVLQLDDVSGVTINQLIDIRESTSDLQNTLDGVWKIIGVDSGTDQITIHYTGHNPIELVAFTATGSIYTTIIEFASKKQGFLLNNSTNTVSLENLGIVSSETDNSSLDLGAGVYFYGSNTTGTLSQVGIIGFDTGLKVARQSRAIVSTVSVSGCVVSGVALEDSGYVKSSDHLISNGNQRVGIHVHNGSRLISEMNTIACNNTTIGILVEGSGSVQCELLTCNYNGEIGFYLSDLSVGYLGSFGIFDYNGIDGIRVESGSVFYSDSDANINANANTVTGIFLAMGASMHGFGDIEVMENGETGIYTHISSLFEAQEIVASANGLVGVVSRLGSCVIADSSLLDTHEEYGLLVRESACAIMGATEAREAGDGVVVPPAFASSGTIIGSGGSTNGGPVGGVGSAGGTGVGDDDGDGDGDGDTGGDLPDYEGGGTGIAARYSSLIVLTGSSLITQNDVGVLSDENSYIDLSSSGSEHPTVSSNEWGVRAQTRGRTKLSPDLIVASNTVAAISPVPNTKNNIIGFNQQ